MAWVAHMERLVNQGCKSCYLKGNTKHIQSCVEGHYLKGAFGQLSRASLVRYTQLYARQGCKHNHIQTEFLTR